MKIVLYNTIINKYGGQRTFERNFIEHFGDKHEILYVYKAIEGGSTNSGKATLLEYSDDIECDIAIYSTAFHQEAVFNAKKVIQIVHANWSALNILLPAARIDSYIAVSDTVKRMLKSRYDIESVAIHNLLEPKKIRIGTFSNLIRGKGIERILELCKMFDEEGLGYEWDVFGDGGSHYVQEIHRRAKDLKNLHFYSAKEDIKSLMNNYTYVAQLSDDEGFCYSVYEALSKHIPCLVTQFNDDMYGLSIYKNCYFVDKELRDVPFYEIFNHIPADFTESDRLIAGKQEESLKKWESEFII